MKQPLVSEAQNLTLFNIDLLKDFKYLNSDCNF